MPRSGGVVGFACLVTVAVAVAVAGCTASRDEATAADLADADCRRPPWFPQPPPQGVRAASCKDERTFRFVLGSGTPATDAEEHAFLEAHRTELHDIEGLVLSGFGSCCAEDDPDSPACVVLGLRLCSTPLPDLVEKLRAIQASDSAVAKLTFRASVQLEGLSGPRCEADDRDCGPVPYLEQNANAAPTDRVPVDPPDEVSEDRADLPEADEPVCKHDGDCVANACGNYCDHWTRGGAAGQCWGAPWLEDAFCGCVDERCRWFH